MTNYWSFDNGDLYFWWSPIGVSLFSSSVPQITHYHHWHLPVVAVLCLVQALNWSFSFTSLSLCPTGFHRCPHVAKGHLLSPNVKLTLTSSQVTSQPASSFYLNLFISFSLIMCFYAAVFPSPLQTAAKLSFVKDNNIFQSIICTLHFHHFLSPHFGCHFVSSWNQWHCYTPEKQICAQSHEMAVSFAVCICSSIRTLALLPLPPYHTRIYYTCKK